MEQKQFDITVDEIVPQGEFMLIEPLEFQGEQVRKSGVFIAGASQGATPTLGLIKKSGPEAKYKPGDTVFFRRYSLDEIEVKVSDGKRKFLFIQNADCIAQYKKHG